MLQISLKFAGAREAAVCFAGASLHPMSTVAATALSAMSAATQRFAAAAGRIARPDASDLPRDIVDLLTAKRDFEANLFVLRVEAEMTDRLLDLKA
jgi:flagellar hook protein FlgE